MDDVLAVWHRRVLRDTELRTSPDVVTVDETVGRGNVGSGQIVRLGARDGLAGVTRNGGIRLCARWNGRRCSGLDV